VELVRESVPHRDPGVTSQYLDPVLAEAPVFYAVVHATQHTRRIRDGFLVPDLGSCRPEVGDVRPLVVRGHLEGAPGPGGGLLEDQGDVETAQTGHFPILALGGLELYGEVEQVTNLGCGVVDQRQEAATLEVNAHGREGSDNGLWAMPS
jgi:hypothetical protein